MRIGILLPNWIGDVVMATPALRALRTLHGENAHIVGITRPLVSEVLAGTDWLDEIITSDYGKKQRLRGIWQTGMRLRQQRFDQLLLFTHSFSSGLIGRLSGVKERVGFGRHAQGWLLTKRLTLPRERGRLVPRSAIEHYLDVVAAVGAPTARRDVELATTPMEQAAAEGVWREHRLHEPSQVVVLNTGGAFGASKSWPSEHFAALAKRIVRRYDAAVLVICGPAEKQAAEDIVRLANDPRVVSLADRPPSLRLSKGCLARANLVISTDSGPRHIAAALGVPTITLFGPTDPRWSDNFQPDGIHLLEPVDCGPCGKRVCPLKHHRCMVDLSVDRVFAAVQQQLQRIAWQQAA
jgi:heptosyltransferase-2